MGNCSAEMQLWESLRFPNLGPGTKVLAKAFLLVPFWVVLASLYMYMHIYIYIYTHVYCIYTIFRVQVLSSQRTCTRNVNSQIPNT